MSSWHKVKVNWFYKQRLIFSVIEEYELGFTNDVTFQFHHFPNNFCGFCNLIGHKIENCGQFAFAQQQAEEKQVVADAILAAMQQIDAQQAVGQPQEPELSMMQQDMQFSKDSLPDTEQEQDASEVTCIEYLKQLDTESVYNDSNELHGLSSTTLASASTLNVAASPYHPNMGLPSDTYMWQVVHKRDRHGQVMNAEAGTWVGRGSSIHLPANGTTYLRNWSLMQSYFHWDLPLPAAKKARIT